MTSRGTQRSRTVSGAAAFASGGRRQSPPLTRAFGASWTAEKPRGTAQGGGSKTQSLPLRHLKGTWKGKTGEEI